MSKPTDSEPPAESGAEAIAGPPSPRDARTAYRRHARACQRCGDVDRDRCADGQQLWRDWEGACEVAYQQLAERTT